MPPSPPSAACFGKLPSHGDFVRYHASGRAMQALDAWVQQGLLRVRQQGHEEAIGAPTVCFLIDLPGTAHALVGALRPSRDRVGRAYPFLVAVGVEKRTLDGRRIPSWPVRYERFYEAAAAFVNDAVDGHLANGDLGRALAGLQAIYDATPFPVDYGYRLRQADTASLWGRTWGDPADGRKYVVLKYLTERLGRARGRAPREAFRIPLPGDPAPLDVSFWLEAYWRLLGRAPDQPALFWDAPSPAADAALYVGSAPPPPDLLNALYAPDAAPGTGVVALDDAQGQPAAHAALALPARYGTLLEDETLDFNAFLNRLNAA